MNENKTTQPVPGGILKTTIGHSIRCYLALSALWFYEHLTNMGRYRHIVTARTSDNLDLFPFKEVYTKDRLPRAKNMLFNAIGALSSVKNFYKYSILREKGAKLLHSHFGNEGWDNIRLARKLRMPHVVSFYGFDMALLPKVDPEWRKSYADLFRAADAFVVEGSKMREALVELGCEEKKVRINHIGVDLKKDMLLPRAIGESGKIKILIVGRFTAKKGIPLAVSAFGKLSSKYRNTELSIIGDSSGSPENEFEKKKIMKIVNEINLEDRIRLLGFQPIELVREEAKKSHVFLSPSLTSSDGDNEGGFPHTVAQFSASGMPILATRHCDLPEVVIDGVTGILAKEGDVDDLAEKLEWLITHPEKWRAFGEMGRKHMEENYDLEKTSRGLEDIYAQFLGAR